MRYLLLLLFCGMTNAAIINVTVSNTDPTDGDCDLYSAIESANTDTAVGGCTAGSGGDTIRLAGNVAYDRLLPVITGYLTIESTSSASKRYIEPLNSIDLRIFETAPGSSLTLRSLILRGGDSLSGNGGCILSNGELSINSSLINYCNSNGYGGAVYANSPASSVSISSSTFNGNSATAQGSALYINSASTSISNSAITNSDISGNSGIYIEGSNQVNITNSNIHGNGGDGIRIFSDPSYSNVPNVLIDRSSVTSSDNNGVYCERSTCRFVNSTFANNRSFGIAGINTGVLVDNSTFFNNLSGQINAGANSNINNSAFGQNIWYPHPPHCSIASPSNGTNNVSDDASCSGINASNVTNLGLAGIAYNNQTRYYVPQTGSPLIAAGNQSVCANSYVNDRDQLFAGRPQPANTNCEVGSIEVNQGTGGTSPDISLIKTGVFNDESNDGYAQPGETITYSFTVTNTGTQTLTNVSISDPLVSVSGSVASLSPGSVSTAFSATYSITQADIIFGQVDNTATVTGTGDDNDVTDTDSHTEPLAEPPSVPNISLIKTGVFDDQSGDGYAQAGETISYSFTVENTGTQVLNNVNISDPLVSVSGSLSNMTPGSVDSSTFSATYTITQADINNGQVNNTATVSGTGDDDTVTDTDSHIEPLSEPPTVPGISLLKSGSFDDNNNDGFAQVGETISYSFTVENTGTQTLNNVYITDPMFNVPGTITGMTPGAVDSTTFTASYALTQSDIDNAQVDNTATVSGTGDDDTVTDIDSHSEPLAVQSSIELTKSGVFVDETGDGYAQIGETIDYSFVVENTGDDTLYNVTISDPLMAVQGQLASLAPGAIDSTTFTGVYGLNAADLSALQVDNIATVTGTSNANGQVTDISNNNVPFVVTYDVLNEITLLKSGVFDDNDGDGFAQPGETITYTFIAENIGSQDLYNAIISDPIISNVTPSPHPDTLYAQAVDVIFDDGFDDDDDAIVTFTGTYIVTQADIDAGFVSNIAEVEATTGDENVTAESNNGVPLIVGINGVPADISLLKFGAFDDNNNDGFAQAGETVSYSFTVENTGGVTLSNVTINDPLFPVAGSLASMAPTAVDSTTFTGVYTLTQADVDAGQVSNLATVTGFDPSNVAVTDQSNSGQPLVTPLPFNNSISLLKSGVFDDNNSDGYAQAGETVTYSFVVENTGTQTLTNVTITDPLVTVSGSLASMAPGAIDNSTFTAVYTLTQTDVDNGIISNTATVTGTTPQSTTVNDNDSHNEPLPNNSGITLVKNGTFDDNSGDGFAQAGETITYSFIVENTSTQTLSNVSISDPLITVSGSLATMGPGAVDNSTFSGTYTLTQADIDNGQVDNVATVTGTTPQNDTVSDVDTHTETLGVNAEIDLLKFGVFDDNNGDGFAQPGETVSYTFTVENTGDVTLSNVTINDPLFTVNGSVASMAPGDVDTSTFTGTYTLTQADVDAAQVSNLATVVGLDPSGVAVTDQSNSGQPLITPLPFNNSINLVKTGSFDDNDGDGFAQAGETVSYSFTVENTGTQTLSNVTISDPLVTVNGSLASMAPGVVDSTTFSAVYTLTQADVNAGVIDNTATVTATDPQDEAVSDSDDHSEPLPVESGIVLIKVGSFNDDDGDGYAQVGETITYGFSVENTSSQTLSNITITDPLITVNGSLASMLPGVIDSTTFSGTYTLTQADIDAGEVINTATVTGTTPQDDSVSDEDTHTEPLPIFRAVVQVPVNNPWALLLLGLIMIGVMRRKLLA